MSVARRSPTFLRRTAGNPAIRAGKDGTNAGNLPASASNFFTSASVRATNAGNLFMNASVRVTIAGNISTSASVRAAIARNLFTIAGNLATGEGENGSKSGKNAGKHLPPGESGQKATVGRQTSAKGQASRQPARLTRLMKGAAAGQFFATMFGPSHSIFWPARSDTQPSSMISVSCAPTAKRE